MAYVHTSPSVPDAPPPFGGEWLLCPDDLKEIMGDLRGEELTLEDLAMTLLSGGIDLEYLSTKYKTNKGDKNLLVVIACQDDLEVDWEDLTRRCERTILAMVGNHLVKEESELEKFEKDPESLVFLTQEENQLPFDSFKGDVFQYARYRAHLEFAKSLLEKTPRVRLTEGGIAPSWGEAHVGPSRRGPDGQFHATNPTRGIRATVCMETAPATKGMHSTLGFPERGNTKAPDKGVPLREFSKVVTEDFEKYYNFLLPWSKRKLKSVLGDPSVSQDPLLNGEEGPG